MNIDLNLRGEVEIIGKENGKIIYYEKGSNMVMLWAKHATMHVLTGDTFGTSGEVRDIDSHTISYNPDGTLISGEQYFYNDTATAANFFWNQSTLGNTYPFFPTKMLFGTGYEYSSYADFNTARSSEEELAIAADGDIIGNTWTEAQFDDLNIITMTSNDYSNIYVDPNLVKARTVNHNSFTSQNESNIDDEDFAISGAVKNGDYTSTSQTTYISDTTGYLTEEKRGIGKPCFIYCGRDNTYNTEGSDVRLTYDDETPTLENKITFTVIMPEQTGDHQGKFYPYNGYILKEAGLFIDARYYLDGSIDSDAELYEKMPYGMLFAKRFFTPFVKTANSSYTIRWTIYL